MTPNPLHLLTSLLLLLFTYSKTDTRVITLFTPHKPGDNIGQFRLQQRLDILGVEKSYVSDYGVGLLPNGVHYTNKYLPEPVAPDDYIIYSHDHDISTLEEVYIDANDESIKNGQFYLDKKIFLGGHGEIWLAREVLDNGSIDTNHSFVLKRMHFKNRPEILRCALREIYFGELLKNNPRVARLVTHFRNDDDYWLVFRDEGVSLQHLLYALTVNKGNVVLEPSAIWRNMRTTRRGHDSMRSILYQIISGVSSLHARGIVHRDVKPSNILINAHGDGTGNSRTRLLVADFSSAVSDEALTQSMYGPHGPTIDEESEQYMPPEVLFSCTGLTDMCTPTPYADGNRRSYDSWSIGVLFAEMILGTADVFSVDQRTAALIRHRMRLADKTVVEDALKLAAMAEWCIYAGPVEGTREDDEDDTGDESIRSVARSYSASDSALRREWSSPSEEKQGFRRKQTSTERAASVLKLSAVSDQYLRPTAAPSMCGIDQLKRALQRRDPLGTGYSNEYGLDLLSRLLKWNPNERIGLIEALSHAYFVGPYVSIIDGSEHMTKADLDMHDSSIVTTDPSLWSEADEASFDLDDDSSEILDDESVLQLYDSSDIMYDEEDYAYRVDALYGIDSLANQVNQLMNPVSQPVADDITAGVPYTLSRSHIRQHIAANHTWRVGHKLDSQYSSGSMSEESTPPHCLEIPGTVGESHDCASDHTHTPDVASQLVYRCPKCNRSFTGNWQSCHAHLTSRKHGRRCIYDTSSQHISLPTCLSSHALLPLDPQSGWCDLQGRRKHIEDAHTVVFAQHYKLFGVLDGHWGSSAAKFTSHHLPVLFEKNMRSNNHSDNLSLNRLDDNMESLPASAVWREAYRVKDYSVDIVSPFQGRSASGLSIAETILSLEDAFVMTDLDFVSALYPDDTDERSGTTATVTVLFDEFIVVGNIGDSRAVLCCDVGGKSIQLTVDHTPYVPEERDRVVAAGGYVETHGVQRVNGQLAVTRSIGDKQLGSVLSSHPDIVVFHRFPRQMHATLDANDVSDTFMQSDMWKLPICEQLMKSRSDVSSTGIGSNRMVPQQQFLILGSDGLWDVISNQDAVEFVCESLVLQLNATIHTTGEGPTKQLHLPVDAFHTAARELALEAYIRGSMDNIGVCVIDLFIDV